MKRFALVGNPNSGKTTLFNLLTGSSQHTGNWPGVTVEKKEGSLKKQYGHAQLVDLPGIYSLSPYTPEEVISRDFITGEHPDAVIDIVDATNLERNLYLALQLIELEVPVVIALNMMDEIRKRGDEIDVKRLSKELGVPVIPISAWKGENVEAVVEAAMDAKIQSHIHVFSPRHEEIVHDIASLVTASGFTEMPARWSAIKLLEKDAPVTDKVPLSSDAYEKVLEGRREIEESGQAPESIFADARYRYITKLIHEVVVKAGHPDILTPSSKIDRVVTNRILAIPIFLLLMWLMFTLTFSENLFWTGIPSPGVWLQGLVETFVGWFSGVAGSIFIDGSWTHSLVVDGVIGGVGAVLSFVPQILMLFLFLTILEDIGYMSRAAFVLDRIFRKFGLSGKSFIPLLMGFGCTVPAVMAARTIENERDRKLTIFITPFIACGAKAPIFAVFTAAFFPRNADTAVMLFYLAGVVLAILSAVVLRKLVFKGQSSPFIMELPPYRLPQMSTVARTLWEKLRGYLVRAGTLIFAMSVVVWFLMNFGWNFKMVGDAMDQSILASIGNVIAPLFTPLGFGNWQASVSLLTGFIAKEAVVGTMGVLYGVGGDAALTTALAQHFTTLSAVAFLTFSLLYVPCVAATSAMRKEFGSWKWTFAQLAYGTGLGWLLGMLIFQIGTALGLG